MERHPNARSDSLVVDGRRDGDTGAPRRIETDRLVLRRCHPDHVAFDCLDAPYVLAGCLATNDPSRRAIETFVSRFGGAYVGSPPTVPSAAGADGSPPVVPHHEWVVTRDQFRSGEDGLSTLVPGVEYANIEF